MTNEEKQALIEACEDTIKYAKDYPSHEVEMAKAALAALTSQPVKPPQRYDAHGFQEPAHVLNSRWIEAIRMAGYEVQE